MRKKAQTATEYLIILAVVIIIALIVIGVLGGIPGLGGGSKAGASQAFWENYQIGVQDVVVTTDGNASMNLKNNMRDTIKVTGITLTAASGGSNSSTTNTVLASGEEGSYSVLGIDSGSAGERYSYTVQINYTNVETAATYTLNGQGSRLEGIRAN